MDALTLDAPRKTRDGFMAVRARAARAGIYEYLGSEVDPKGERFKASDTVKVYRPADAVFAADSVASFVGKPVTNDHPSQPVTADNWKQHSRGAIMGALRDGEYLAFDLTIMDAAAIADIEAGKRELSNGYACDIAFEAGTTPDGHAYDAVQRDIRGNHVAIVRKGRAGSACRIGDAAPEIRFAVCDANPAATRGFHPEKTMKTITLDGLPVNLGDEAAVEAAIAKLKDKAAQAETDAKDAQAAHDKAMAAKDAEIDALKAKVIDADKIDAIADAKADIAAKAKSLLGDKAPDLKGKSLEDCRRAVLAAKGIEVADKSDDYVAARYDALVDGIADAKADTPKVVPLNPANFADTATVRDAIRAARYA